MAPDWYLPPALIKKCDFCLKGINCTLKKEQAVTLKSEAPEWRQTEQLSGKDERWDKMQLPTGWLHCVLRSAKLEVRNATVSGLISYDGYQWGEGTSH